MCLVCAIFLGIILGLIALMLTEPWWLPPAQRVRLVMESYRRRRT